MRRLEISQKDIHQRFQRISTGTPLECCLGPRNEIEGIGGNLVKRGGGGGGGGGDFLVGMCHWHPRTLSLYQTLFR